MFKRTDTEFNLDRHIITFLQDSRFFAEISRHIRKVPTDDIPTAAVSYDPVHDEIALFWNPAFFESMTPMEIKGVLLHEYSHLIFGHLNTRRKNPPKMWNIATDLAINSLIVDGNLMGRNSSDEGGKLSLLPKIVLLPGRWPVNKEGNAMSQEEKDAAPLAALIAGFPTMEASEWYFAKLQEFAQEQKAKGGDDDGEGWGFDSFDSHDSWDNIPEDQREYIEGKVKSIIEKGVREADRSASGWGNIPAELREDIRRSISTTINWRAVLRQFMGSIVRGHRTTSIKRINRRYPYIHPGTKRGYVAKLMIAIDQSGSVDDGMLADFFAELNQLTKKVDITILPFDCAANVKDCFEWKRGTKPPMKRVKAGGTDFNAPTEVFNDPKNRGRWDGLLIMTDGQANSPIAARGKRGWVLGKDQKLYFTSSELQVVVSDEKKMSGAWR